MGSENTQTEKRRDGKEKKKQGWKKEKGEKREKRHKKQGSEKERLQATWGELGMGRVSGQEKK